MKAAVRLLFLLGQRATETLLGLRWDGLDLDATIPMWTIPGTFRKGGQLHVVPLPKTAVDMIEALRPVTGASASGRVLDGVSEKNYEVTWWGRVRDRALDLAAQDDVEVAHFTRHDCRRTCVTGMTSLGVAPFVADLVVGHVVRIEGVAGRTTGTSTLRAGIGTPAHGRPTSGGSSRAGGEQGGRADLHGAGGTMSDAARGQFRIRIEPFTAEDLRATRLDSPQGFAYRSAIAGQLFSPALLAGRDLPHGLDLAVCWACSSTRSSRGAGPKAATYLAALAGAGAGRVRSLEPRDPPPH